MKSAALLDVQSNIYDRTAGCLALPGAFGYGHVFSLSEVVYFSAKNGPAEFLKWVFEVTPGRYCVTQYGGSGSSYKPIIAYDGGQPYFRGFIDIEIRCGIGSGGIESEDGRWITFHGDREYSGATGEGRLSIRYWLQNQCLRRHFRGMVAAILVTRPTETTVMCRRYYITACSATG